METGPFFVAALGLLAGAFFFVRARTATNALGQLRDRIEAQGADLEQARAQRQKDVDVIARHGSEVADLRKRLEKAKRRAAQAGGRKVGSKPASALQTLEFDLEQTRRARDESRAEALALSQELSRVRSEARAPKQEVAPLLDNAEIESLQQRLESATRAVGEAREEVSRLKKSDARLKRKLSTQEILYVSMRSELDAKKDRLRTQQEELERLMALKVALTDSPEPTESSPELEPAVEHAGLESSASPDFGERPIEPGK